MKTEETHPVSIIMHAYQSSVKQLQGLLYL